MDDKQRTIEYYNANATAFTADTAEADVHMLQDWFLSHLKPGAFVMDLGCGTGRDTKYFLSKGYRVDACDGSEAMCRTASELTGLDVKQLMFNDLEYADTYDGIWACASILHVPFAELPGIFERIAKALKPDGILYISFKYGEFEGMRGGRYYSDLNEKRLALLLQHVPDLSVMETGITDDVRPGRKDEKWLNAIIRKS